MPYIESVKKTFKSSCRPDHAGFFLCQLEEISLVWKWGQNQIHFWSQILAPSVEIKVGAHHSYCRNVPHKVLQAN